MCLWRLLSLRRVFLWRLLSLRWLRRLFPLWRLLPLWWLWLRWRLPLTATGKMTFSEIPRTTR